MATTPSIDYTNKDFQSLRQAMLALARYRLPEWTDQSASDLGVVLVDLFAYMGDVILYYQDRIANESFLTTATERRSVLYALRLLGYELAPPVPATAELSLVFTLPAPASSSIVVIPKGAQFAAVATASTPAQTFEYLGTDLTLDVRSDQVVPSADGKKATYAGLPLLQSSTQPPTIIGSSTGEPNQIFAIPGSPVIASSLVVEIDEGAGWVSWTQRASLLYDTAANGQVTLSNAAARDYFVQYDENDVGYVGFGDGTYGRIPPPGSNTIRVTASVGGGSAGNVPANAITVAKTVIPLLDSVTNPLPAAGGADHETIDHAKAFGPLAFRSSARAVTLSDYVALAQTAGGVAKVRATAPNWNTIELYVAPQGPVASAVPETLRRQLISFFEDKRMAGTSVEIIDATYIGIDVSVELVYDPRYHGDAVSAAAAAAIGNLLAFANVDFGQPLYLSDVYAAVESLPGVTAMTVNRFRRSDSAAAAVTNAQIDAVVALLPTNTTVDFATLIQRAVQIDIATDGRIEIGDFEIPVLGSLDISLEAAS